LAKHRFEKLFSREEADEVIPRLELLVRRLQLEGATLRSRAAELAASDPEGEQSSLQDVIDRYPELRAVATLMAELAGEIESYGCLLKDIDLGLVDFPSELNGKVVFLCWQFGEPRIVAWHALEAGFSGRHALPGAPKTYLN
jgi:hypothetical protein